MKKVILALAICTVLQGVNVRLAYADEVLVPLQDATTPGNSITIVGDSTGGNTALPGGYNLDTMINQTTANHNNISTLNTEMSSVATRVANNSTEITNQQQQITNNTNEIIKNQTANEAAILMERGNINALRTRADATDTGISDIKQAQSDTNANVTSVKQAQAVTNANVASVKQAQATTNANVAKNSANIASHETRIENLEANTGSGQRFAALKSEVEDNRQRASAGIAGVAAMANIPQVIQGQTFSIGAGTGTTDGESALAVGFSARATEHVVVKGSVSDDTQQNFVVGAGASYGW